MAISNEDISFEKYKIKLSKRNHTIYFTAENSNQDKNPFNSCKLKFLREKTRQPNMSIYVYTKKIYM